jgi:two-component system chemotaxis response regulator CheB
VTRVASKIKVLVVDDSMFFRAMIVKGFKAFPEIDVVGEAFDPYDARDKILELEPHVMSLDLEMPFMNGIEFLKVLLPQWPIPVVVVSSAAQKQQEALKAGAVDFLSKPTDKDPDSIQRFVAEMARRIIKAGNAGRTRAYRQNTPSKQTAETSPVGGKAGFTGVISLGASTGGTQSTAKILKALPADIPPMVIVQHMPPDFTRMYAENLDRDCAMSVREAKDGDLLTPGTALIAPGGNRHIEIVKRGAGYAVHLFAGEKVNGHCPSVDVLFRSAAKVVPGPNSVGIILTGMGSDGAQGLLAMRRAGAYTIGQDEHSSVVYGMPREAYELGAVERQASLDNIAAVLMNYLRDQRR